MRRNSQTPTSRAARQAAAAKANQATVDNGGRRQGKARKEGRVYHDDKTWWIITRLELQRTDHALIGDGDLR